MLVAIWLAGHSEAWVEGMKGLVNAAEPATGLTLAGLTDREAYSFC
jgi:hypothetical protein